MTGKMKLTASHRPNLAAGDYKIMVTATDPDGTNVVAPEEYAFRIDGPGDVPAAQDIQSQFPPRDAHGAFATTIPHVEFRSSAFPWLYQRHDSSTAPWVALILLTDDQEQQFSILPPASEGEAPKLQIDTKFFTTVKPTAKQASQLVHVRTNGTEEDCAVMLCNRVLPAGRSGTVCLVSLRGPPQVRGNRIELPCLFNWRYHANEDARTKFEQIFDVDNLRTRHLRLPYDASPKIAPAVPLLNSGYAPVQLRRSDGQNAVAFYRGPLLPLGTDFPPAPAPDDPIPNSAADLFVPAAQTGLEDITYAAAWELGRLLALRDQGFTNQMIAWKSSVARKLRHAADHDTLTNISFRAQSHTAPFPRAFFDELSRLVNVPLGYLLPDAEMLPVETLCAITLDKVWILRLLQGAMSVGAELFRCPDHATAAAEALEKEAQAHQTILREICTLDKDAPAKTGILLRSEAVTLWPDLHISFERTGHGGTVEPVKIRTGFPETPGTGIRLAVVEEPFDQLRVQLPRNVPHFELSPDDAVWPPAAGLSSVDIAIAYRNRLRSALITSKG